MRIAALTILLLLAALPAAARPPTPDEAEKLGRAVDSFMRTIGAKDAEKMVEAIPPRIIGIQAGATGIEMTKINDQLVEGIKAATKGARFEDVSADKSALDMGDATLKDGTPVVWSLVPVSFTVEVGEKRTRMSRSMLAVEEQNRWYFLQIDSPAAKALVQIAYPFLAEATIPDAVTAPAP